MAKTKLPTPGWIGAKKTADAPETIAPAQVYVPPVDGPTFVVRGSALKYPGDGKPGKTGKACPDCGRGTHVVPASKMTTIGGPGQYDTCTHGCQKCTAGWIDKPRAKADAVAAKEAESIAASKRERAADTHSAMRNEIDSLHAKVSELTALKA